MNSVFFTSLASGKSLPRLRLKRRERARNSPNVKIYRLFASLTPHLNEWVELGEDGWGEISSAGLSKDDLSELWHNEEAEIQQEHGTGEWNDVFSIDPPGMHPANDS